LKKYGLIIYISKTDFSCLFNNKTNTLDGGTLYTKDWDFVRKPKSGVVLFLDWN
jgi:hypothetical protein